MMSLSSNQWDSYFRRYLVLQNPSQWKDLDRMEKRQFNKLNVVEALERATRVQTPTLQCIGWVTWVKSVHFPAFHFIHVKNKIVSIAIAEFKESEQNIPPDPATWHIDYFKESYLRNNPGKDPLTLLSVPDGGK